MQDYSIVDYDRLEKEMKGEKDVKAVWRRLLSLLKFFLNTVLVCFYLSVAVLAFFLVQHSITEKPLPYSGTGCISSGVTA